MEVFTLKHYLLAFIVVILLIFTACSEDDDTTSTAIYGYSMDQFVNQAEILAITDSEADQEEDFRNLYAYQILAEDGFSPRNSSNAGYDLDWDVFSQGYLVPDDEMRVWFSDPEIPGAFRVKNTNEIRLYRKVEIQSDSKQASFIELGALPVSEVQNWDETPEDAIRLSDLVVAYEDYESITLAASDGYTQSYTPEQIADGYYLLESEVTTFPSFNEDMDGGQKKFKKLASITVTGGSTVEHEAWDNTPEDKADLTITIPELFDGFEATELTDF